MASVLFAATGGALFWWAAQTSGAGAAAALILAAVCCQLRLACNLLDGLVAVEGGRSTPDGAFWNEAPDRLSDILLVAGAGVAAGAPALGWAAAALAVATAYIREFGRAEGMQPDYSGPMAKPHRMAALTIGTVLAAIAAMVRPDLDVLHLTLWIVVGGSVLTVCRRADRIVRWMNRRV